MRVTNQHNVYLGGIPILLIVFAATYLFGALYTSKLDDESYKALMLRRYRKIDDNFSYKFIQALRNQNPDVPFILNWQSLKVNDQIISFISSCKTPSLKHQVKIELIERALFKIRIWDGARLDGIKLLTGREITRNFDGEELRVSWENFRLKYGNGYHEFSIPISDRKEEFVVVQHVFRCDALYGSGEFILFGKRNGVWIELEKKQLWMS